MTSDFKNLLTEYVALKSISTDPQYKGEMLKTAEWIKAYLQKFGFTVEFIQGSTCNPVVFGSLTTNISLPTVLIYGHYYVQPSDQFDLVEIDGRLVGRGVVDNKGQNLIHIYTVCKLAQEKKLKYNIKFLIEGNEETGNDDMSDLLRLHKDKLKSDIVLVSDGEIAGENPCIEVSLRGGFNCRLVYTTAKTNVHSGLFGGAIPNAAYEMAKFLNKLQTPDNQINIPGFYDGVDNISNSERQNNIQMGKIADNLIHDIGVTTYLTEPDTDFFTQTGLRPTIQITGIKSGYIGDGYANIVPATAEARLNFRLVKSQEADNIISKLREFVKQNTPDYIKYELIVGSPHNPVKLNISNPIFGSTISLLEQSFGQPILMKNVGGAIPFVSDIKEIFGVDTLLVPLANDDCNMHGDNENFRIDLIDKGLQFSEKFFTMSS